MYFLDATSSGTVASKVETDPLGTVVDYSNSYMSGGGSGPTQIGFYGTPQMPNMGCSVQGVPTPCGMAAHMVNVGMYDRSQVVFGDPAANGSLSGTWGLQNINYTLGRRGNDNVGESRGRGYAFEHGYLWMDRQTPVWDGGWRGEFRQAGPQQTVPNTWSPEELADLIKEARGVVERAAGKCAELLGKDALSQFDKISKNIEFKGNLQVTIPDRMLGYIVVRLDDTKISAYTIGENIYLNPFGEAFNKYANGKVPQELHERFVKMGASGQHEYAVAALIHEFLHATGKFGPDSTTDYLTGRTDSSKSIKNQKEVLKKCFPKEKK